MFLNYKSCSCRSTRKKKTTPPPKSKTHTFWRNPNVSCSGRQDVKSIWIYTFLHQSTSEKKYFVVNLYIQMQLGIYTYITLFNVYTFITHPPAYFIFNNFLCKTFIQTPKRCKTNLRGGKKDNHFRHLKCSLSKSQNV